MTERECAHCGDQFTARHRDHRYCSRACRRSPKQAAPHLGGVVTATEKAIKAAKHLTDMDLGAVAALRVLARKLDALDSEDVTSLEDLKAKFDNVTLPTYLKYCESLGLTPAGRSRVPQKKEAASGTLGKLRSVPRPDRSA